MTHAMMIAAICLLIAAWGCFEIASLLYKIADRAREDARRDRF